MPAELPSIQNPLKDSLQCWSILHSRQECPPILRKLMEHSPHASLGCLAVALCTIHMEGSKQTNAAVLPPSWLCVDSQPLAVSASLHLSHGESSPERLPGSGVDPSRLIIIPDQPPSHLKSLREDLSRSSFCSLSCLLPAFPP